MCYWQLWRLNAQLSVKMETMEKKVDANRMKNHSNNRF